jgi:hypothetical protein
MTDEELARRLEMLDPDKRSGVVKLGCELLDDALGPARSAVQYWRSRDPWLVKKARSALTTMKEVPLDPLLAAETPESPHGRVELAQLIAAAVIDLESRVFARLWDFCQDTRDVLPPEETGPSEEPLLETRVCDEAWVLLRQLSHFRETELQFIMNRDAFLNLPDELKDKEILRARNAKNFLPLVEDVEEDEEF